MMNVFGICRFALAIKLFVICDRDEFVWVDNLHVSTCLDSSSVDDHNIRVLVSRPQTV